MLSCLDIPENQLKQPKIKRYKRKQTLPPEAVLRQVPNFTRIHSDPDKPLLIYGSDDSLLLRLGTRKEVVEGRFRRLSREGRLERFSQRGIRLINPI